ncbi:membrane cofactor protein-like [Saccopteryx leptura]|uniref:membrane cofactor protein-like n=1 Tax=Saccopteryx leptura TaxID=249018 RepID=UPI00339CA258
MLTVCQFSIDIRKMTVSPKPRRAPSYHLESLFSSWRFVGIHLVTLVLLLPSGSDACDVPPKFQSMMLRGASQTVYQPGDTVEYECRLGYMRIVPLVSTTAVCQADNTWTPLQEACTKKSCVNLAEPRNGQVTYVNGSTTFGSQAHYECNEGFYLLGIKILYCEISGDKMEWSDNPPLCEKILCQPPKKIPHGTYTNSQKDTYEYNEVVTYSCNPSNGPDEYSLVGKRTLICSGQDQWSSDPPECKVVKCPYPVVNNGRIVSIIGTKYSYRTRVTFQCLKGFLFEGSNSAVCGANSTWVPGLPKCTQGVQPTVPKTTPVSSKPGVKPTVPKTTTPGLSTSSAERFEYLGSRLTALTIVMARPVVAQWDKASTWNTEVAGSKPWACLLIIIFLEKDPRWQQCRWMSHSPPPGPTRVPTKFKNNHPENPVQDLKKKGLITKDSQKKPH